LPGIVGTIWEQVEIKLRKKKNLKPKDKIKDSGKFCGFISCSKATLTLIHAFQASNNNLKIL